MRDKNKEKRNDTYSERFFVTLSHHFSYFSDIALLYRKVWVF